MSLKLRLNVLQLCPHAVASGLPLKVEFSVARETAYEGETQEREGFRFSESTPLAVISSDRQLADILLSVRTGSNPAVSRSAACRILSSAAGV
jgi:hypothetical protein